mgnify:CR=1 FL=1
MFLFRRTISLIPEQLATIYKSVVNPFINLMGIGERANTVITYYNFE